MKGYKEFIISMLAMSAITACSGNDDEPEQQNVAPVAKVQNTVHQTYINTKTMISGETSYDPDGDQIQYTWTLLDESGQTIETITSDKQNYEFNAIEFGVFTISLQVQDQELSSQTVTTNITVIPTEQDFPIVGFTADKVSKVGENIWLNASDSRGTNGQLISYQWQWNSKPDNSNAEISDTTKVMAYFIPDVEGEYDVNLVVKNSEDDLESETSKIIKVDELQENSAPIAKIDYQDKRYTLEETLTLSSVSSSDADNDPLTTLWELLSSPTGSLAQLSNINTEQTSLKFDVEGDYTVKLTVSDGELSDSKEISISATYNNAQPVADAGDDLTATIGQDVVIDASNSTDSDGDDLLYGWALISIPKDSDLELSDSQVLRDDHLLDFLPDVIGDYVLSLEVFDGELYSESDTVKVSVYENAPPVAVLPDDFTVYTSSVVTIDGSKSFDNENEELTFKWRFISVPEGYSGSIVSSSIEKVAVFLPSVNGIYSIELVVNDGSQDSIAEIINITRDENPNYTRTVTGRLVDGSGNPIAGVSIGGLYQNRITTSDSGEFDLELSSSFIGGALNILMFNHDNKIFGQMGLEEYVVGSNNTVNFGDVLFPVMQFKQISIESCEGYSGPAEVTVNFALTSIGYENSSFQSSSTANFIVDGDVTRLELPSSSHLLTTATSSGELSVTSNGVSYLSLKYEENEQAVLTVCERS